VSMIKWTKHDTLDETSRKHILSKFWNLQRFYNILAI